MSLSGTFPKQESSIIESLPHDQEDSSNFQEPSNDALPDTESTLM